MVPTFIKGILKRSLYGVIPYSFSQKLDRTFRSRRFEALSDQRPPGLEHGFLFIHVPRTGGTSIKEALLPDVEQEVQGHVRAYDWRLVCAEGAYTSAFKFGFVRDPWDRLVSSYRYLNSGGWGERDKEWAEKHLADVEDINSFVMEWLREDRLYAYPHFIPQSYWLTDPSGNLEVDFVGRYESLASNFQTICDRLDIETELPHVNATEGVSGSYHDCYTVEAAEKVADLYKDDIERFGYRLI